MHLMYISCTCLISEVILLLFPLEHKDQQASKVEHTGIGIFWDNVI